MGNHTCKRNKALNELPDTVENLISFGNMLTAVEMLYRTLGSNHDHMWKVSLE